MYHFCDDVIDGDVIQPGEKLSFQLAEGPAVQMTIDMKEFVEYGETYFTRNTEDYKKVFQFPPEWMIEESAVKDLATCFLKVLANVRGLRVALLGYSYDAHYKLFKNSIVSSEYEQFNSEECPLLIFCSDLNVILHIRICLSPDRIGDYLKQCRVDIRAFIRLHHYAIQNRSISIIGIVHCPNLTKQEFGTVCDNFFSMQTGSPFDLFLLHEDIGTNPMKLQKWWNTILEPAILKISSCTASPVLDNVHAAPYGVFPNIVGSCMAVMAATDVQLPSLSKNPEIQMATLMLTTQQYEAIYSPKQHKIISGCFGSGKSVVGKEIVKKLMKEEPDSILVYACLESFSLLECEMRRYVQVLHEENPKAMLAKVIPGSFSELCKEIQFDGEMTMCKFFTGFSKKYKNVTVHFVLEEVPGDFLTEKESLELRHLCQKDLWKSKVVLLMQGVEKKREVSINSNRFSYKQIVRKRQEWNYLN